MGKDFNRNIWAIGVIVLGIILFLKYLGICDLNIFFDGWWTLIFIIPAIISLCKKDPLSEKLTAGVVLLSGLLVLADEQHFLPERVNVWMAVGALIVIRVGVGMAMKDEETNVVKKSTTSKDKDVIEVKKTETPKEEKVEEVKKEEVHEEQVKEVKQEEVVENKEQEEVIEKNE